MTDPSIAGQPSEESTSLGRAAAIVIALTGLWLLAGAIFKLVWGSPNLLPPVLHDVPLAIGTTYRLAIAVELVLGFLALVRPRWPPRLASGHTVLFRRCWPLQSAW